MKALRRVLRRLLTLDPRRRDNDRLEEELELHLQMQVADNLLAGMAPEEARRQAVIAFGPLEAIKERYRDEQRVRLVDDFMLDVRYAFRQRRNSPVFTLTATISLAMGIGANAETFTLVERLLLRPLPVEDPHELVYVTDERILTQPSPRFSYPFYALVRENTVLEGVAARVAIPVNVTGRSIAISRPAAPGCRRNARRSRWCSCPPTRAVRPRADSNAPPFSSPSH